MFTSGERFINHSIFLEVYLDTTATPLANLLISFWSSTRATITNSMFYFDDYLPSSVSQFDAAIMIIASLGTSFLTAALGIGGGTALLVLLALFLPPAALIPVHSFVQFGSNVGRLLIMIFEVNWKPFIPFCIGTIIGCCIAGLFVIQLPSFVIQLAVGFFILWIVFAQMPAIPSKFVFLAGVVSSFSSMFIGATGNFVAAVVKTMKLQPVQHVATHSALATFQHFVKSFVFGFVGFNFSEYLTLIFGMIVSGFIGTVVGRKVLTTFGASYFKPLLNVIFVVIAIKLLWDGFEHLLFSYY